MTAGIANVSMGPNYKRFEEIEKKYAEKARRDGILIAGAFFILGMIADRILTAIL